MRRFVVSYLIPYFFLASICLWKYVASHQLKCTSKGHIDHYYHFFFNCFVPVILHHHAHPNKALHLCDSKIGEMQKIFEAVVPKLTVIEQCNSKNGEPMVLPGYDGDFGAGVIRLSSHDRRMVINQLLDTMPRNQRTNYTQLEVLLIGRAPPVAAQVRKLRGADIDRTLVDTEDKEEKLDITTSGSQRRAIKNFKELANALKHTYPPKKNGEQRVAVAYLENLPIHAQFRLFRSARVIIAQHGAGLSNLFFVRNSTVGVIEISPYSTDNRIGKYTTAFPNCFEYLASNVHIKYSRISQPGEFSDVDIFDVLKVVKQYLGY